MRVAARRAPAAAALQGAPRSLHAPTSRPCPLPPCAHPTDPVEPDPLAHHDVRAGRAGGWWWWGGGLARMSSRRGRAARLPAGTTRAGGCLQEGGSPAGRRCSVPHPPIIRRTPPHPRLRSFAAPHDGATAAFHRVLRHEYGVNCTIRAEKGQVRVRCAPCCGMPAQGKVAKRGLRTRLHGLQLCTAHGRTVARAPPRALPMF